MSRSRDVLFDDLDIEQLVFQSRTIGISIPRPHQVPSYMASCLDGKTGVGKNSPLFHALANYMSEFEAKKTCDALDRCPSENLATCQAAAHTAPAEDVTRLACDFIVQFYNANFT